MHFTFSSNGERINIYITLEEKSVLKTATMKDGYGRKVIQKEAIKLMSVKG
jgi:hypothetical protein